jgi:soluble lytic murein transglycosylase-like protein
LNKALSQAPNSYYVWRTVTDDKVRASHAALNGTLRQWSEQPNPSTDYNCRCWAERLSNKAEDRKKAILGKGHADFSLAPNNSASDEIPWYFDHAKHEVTKYKLYILQESKEQKIDKTLIKAIIYLETTQGWYDGYLPKTAIKTIRPMNIHVSYWKDFGYSRKDLLNPAKNIEAGVKLLKRIIKSSPSKLTVVQIGTLYNNLAADKISNYGVRLESIYKNQPWQHDNSQNH